MVRTTSLAAYEAIKESDMIGRRQQHIYSVLYEHGPLTANQIASKAHIFSVPCGPGIHARLSELRNFGVVKECAEGPVVCPISKMEVILWDVTDTLPVRPKIKYAQGKVGKLKEALFNLIKACHEQNVLEKHPMLIAAEETWSKV